MSSERACCKEYVYFRHEDTSFLKSKVTGKVKICEETSEKQVCWTNLKQYVPNYLIQGHKTDMQDKLKKKNKIGA